MLVLIEVDFGKAEPSNHLQFGVGATSQKRIERIHGILITTFFHIQFGHGKPGQGGISRRSIVVVQVRRYGLRCVEIAVVDLAGQRLIARRCLHAAGLLLSLPKIPADENRNTEHNATNHVEAVLLPPGSHCLDLFFFR